MKRKSLNDEMPISFAETRISPEQLTKKSIEVDHKEAREMRLVDPNLYEKERYLNRLKFSEMKMNQAYDNLHNNYQQIESERQLQQK